MYCNAQGIPAPSAPKGPFALTSRISNLAIYWYVMNIRYQGKFMNNILPKYHTVSWYEVESQDVSEKMHINGLSFPRIIQRIILLFQSFETKLTWSHKSQLIKKMQYHIIHLVTRDHKILISAICIMGAHPPPSFDETGSGSAAIRWVSGHLDKLVLADELRPKVFSSQ